MKPSSKYPVTRLQYWTIMVVVYAFILVWIVSFLLLISVGGVTISGWMHVAYTFVFVLQFSLMAALPIIVDGVLTRLEEFGGWHRWWTFFIKPISVKNKRVDPTNPDSVDRVLNYLETQSQGDWIGKPSTDENFDYCFWIQKRSDRIMVKLLQ